MAPPLPAPFSTEMTPPVSSPARALRRTRATGVALAGLSAVAVLEGGVTAQVPRLWAVLWAGALPLAAVLGALWVEREPWRSRLCLLGVPVALALGALARPAAPLDPIVLSVTGVVLLGYLGSAARLLAAEGGAAVTHAPRRVEVPVRVQRRLRLYRAFTVLTALAFLLPLGAAVVAVAGDEAGSPLLLVAAAGLLGALAARAFLIDALERHLQRDPALASALRRLRRHARAGRPARVFYVAAALALVGMLAFALREALGLALVEAP